MDDVSVGKGLRALRKRQGWTQRELAKHAGVPQSTICSIEAGRLETVRLPTLRRCASVLRVTLEFAPRWPIADVARLLDAEHAALVERVVRLLKREGWEVIVEYTFNDFGERGSVDVVAWHPTRRVLLLVEVKSRVADVQETLATFDRKVRVVPKAVARERGWRPTRVGRLLVVGDSHANRERVRRHAATFETTFPTRSRAVRRWIHEPVGSLAGLWFLPNIGPADQVGGKRSWNGERKAS